MNARAQWAAAGAMMALAAPAHATVVTFSSVTPYYFTGQVTEDGFVYSVPTGVLFGNSLGNSGSDLEGSVLSGGGVAAFTMQSGGLFTFSGLDYAAFNGMGTGGSQTLEVSGYLNGVLVGTDLFGLKNSKRYSPSYPNWKTFGSSNLSTMSIDRLQITLQASLHGDSQVLQAIDNVRFGPPALPEPSTWAMMLLGFGVVGIGLRRKRMNPDEVDAELQTRAG